jgi:MoaA/NifB/PqqE/SkfB family radical SAM enzyme
MEEEIIKNFISVEDKYGLKENSSYEDIANWQNKRKIKDFSIKPLQFTIELTNKCNCNCKDCGMAANRIKTDRTVITDEELIKIVDDLDEVGIPAYALTGGEPFLFFDKMCKMMKYASGKLDVIKIISNGFWGKNVKYYFDKLEESGLFKNKYFVPTMQISIGEQTVPLEDVCNIIKYVSDHYTIDELKFGIINTSFYGEEESKLTLLYNTYIEKYGEFPKNKIYLTTSYYINSNPLSNEKLDVPSFPAYDILSTCNNRFKQVAHIFVSPKLFIKCNGDAYPCEVFNLHKEVYLGNYFKDGLINVMKNYDNNIYVNFIKNNRTTGFRKVIPKKILEEEKFEHACTACEFCIKFCEKNNLIR